MIRYTNTAKPAGINPVIVTCEVSVTDGIGIHCVGLADAVVKQSLLRTVTALQSNGFRIPGKKIIINLAPADLVKSGSGYDLAIALTVIAASKQDNGKLDNLEKWLVFGELALDGRLRAAPGAVHAVQAALNAGLHCIIPEESIGEVAELYAAGNPVWAANNYVEAMGIISDEKSFPTLEERYHEILSKNPKLEQPSDNPADNWNNIVGNDGAKRAVEIAAAGGHSIAFVGAPGSCKGFLAKALRDLLPPMTEKEAKTNALIYSHNCGLGRQYANTIQRPFRAPHYSCSLAALMGGGSGESVRPGEVSLANAGVLYLEEVEIAPKAVHEALRAPVEDKKVVITRLKSKIEYPADFILALGLSPCPCGYYGEGDRCTCTHSQRLAYISRYPTMLLDHVTVQAYTRVPSAREADIENEPFNDVKERVRLARFMQKKRYKGTKYRTNDELDRSGIEEFIPLNEECMSFIGTLISRLELSARAYSRIIKIARTIADLAGSEEVTTAHLAEAASYRFLDRLP